MSRKASQFQKKAMSRIYRGKEIFKPLNTGRIDGHVSCIREWIANIFFYTRNGTTIMIDAGYNYDRLAEKMSWLDIDPSDIKDVLITHQDTDHVGALERDSDGLLSHATLHIGEIENRYLTGEVRRKVLFGCYTLPQVYIDNPRHLLQDGDVFTIGSATWSISLMTSIFSPETPYGSGPMAAIASSMSLPWITNWPGAPWRIWSAG